MPITAHRWTAPLEGGRDTGNQATASGWHEHDIDIGQLLDDLSTKRRSACHDRGVVERMHQRCSQLLEAGQCMGYQIAFDQLEGRTHRSHSVDLELHRTRGHADRDGQSKHGADMGNRHRMISGGEGEETSRLLGIGELARLVEGTAHLEAAGRLEQLALQPDVAAQVTTEAVGPKHRGALYMRCYRDDRGIDGGIGDQLGHGVLFLGPRDGVHRDAGER